MKTKFFPQEGLSYDDITIIPNFSSIQSRKDIDLSFKSETLNLKYPLLSAPMNTVTDKEMNSFLYSYGCLGVIHRYQSMLNRANSLEHPGIVSIGLKEDFQLLDVFEDNLVGICVDVAHGAQQSVINYLDRLRNYLIINYKNGVNFPVISGNVVDGPNAERLFNAGANYIRVGIGGGGSCTTRVVTGIGVPNATALFNTRKYFYAKNRRPWLIADGGIKGSAEAAKAFALGADLVMVGSLLAGTLEAPGEVLDGFKEFKGMASHSARLDAGNPDDMEYGEGHAGLVKYKGSAKPILDRFFHGIRSSMSYVGAKNLKEFYDMSQVIKISMSSIQEGKPHAF